MGAALQKKMTSTKLLYPSSEINPNAVWTWSKRDCHLTEKNCNVETLANLVTEIVSAEWQRFEGVHTTRSRNHQGKSRTSRNSTNQASLWCLLVLHSYDRRLHLTSTVVIHTRRKQIEAQISYGVFNEVFVALKGATVGHPCFSSKKPLHCGSSVGSQFIYHRPFPQQTSSVLL